MSDLLRPIIETLQFNTVNVNYGLEDIKNPDSLKQIIGGNPNSLTFTVCHLIGSRYMIVSLIEMFISLPRTLVGLWVILTLCMLLFYRVFPLFYLKVLQSTQIRMRGGE